MVPHPSGVVNLVQRLVYATTGRFILSSSQRVIVLNSRVEGFLLGRGIRKNKIVYLPNGVDGRSFAPPIGSEKQSLRDKYGLPADRIIALFVGRFVPKKGFKKLFDLDPLDNVDFLFAGGDRPVDHIRGDHHFLGSVGHEDIPKIFRMCDIFVLPSEGEGFPVTVQEAMASGLAIVLGDDPAYEPYGLDRSLVQLIRPDMVEIREVLRRTAKDEALRRDMAAYSREYALKHFDWEVHVAQLLSLYSEACTSVKSAGGTF
jgi:rhamnosyl/mannosyltransferase